jgi:hypothetical protein
MRHLDLDRLAPLGERPLDGPEIGEAVEAEARDLVVRRFGLREARHAPGDRGDIPLTGAFGHQLGLGAFDPRRQIKSTEHPESLDDGARSRNREATLNFVRRRAPRPS